VRACDGAGVFPVAFDALAGAVPPPLPPGSVAYISTGAPLPAGADAVVQIEDTERVPADENDGGGGGGGAPAPPRVRIVKAAPSPGADVRATGSDIAAGETVLAAGDVVGPAEVGLAATVGVDSLTVHSLPLVAVLSTGDEVVEAGAEAGEGQVRERERRERGGGEGRDKNTGGPVFNPPRSPHIDP
jgi:gephyrin